MDVTFHCVPISGSLDKVQGIILIGGWVSMYNRGVLISGG